MVDYNDHHKHGYYLVLNAGLPGFGHRELASSRCWCGPTARPCRPRPRGVLDADDDDRLMRLRRACGWPSSSSAAARVGSGR